MHDPRLLAKARPAETSGRGKLTFRLYLCFIVSWFLHIPQRVPAVGVLRLDLLLIIGIAVLIALDSASERPTPDRRINRLVGLIIALVTLSAPFVEWPGTAIKAGLPMLVKGLVFYYFTAMLTTDKKRLKQLLWVFTLCQSFRVLEPVYLHLTQGYWGSMASMANWEYLERLAGAPNDTINPNGLAFVVLTVLPFAHYIWTSSKLGTLLYAAALPLWLYALTLTGSRSGMVGLVVVFGVIWIYSQRKVALALLLVIGTASAIPYLSADQLDRYVSIYDSHTKNAGTAEGRVDGWALDFGAAMRRPLLGHGLGTSLEVNAHFTGRAQPSHNIYLEALQETGVVGLLLFCALMWTILMSVRTALTEISAASSPDQFLVRLCRALLTFTCMNVLFGFFSYGLTSYEWYFLSGLSAVLTSLMRKQDQVAPAVERAPMRGMRIRPNPQPRTPPQGRWAARPRLASR
jgi:putative inorganic carbon (HCO3(-)) transporter